MRPTTALLLIALLVPLASCALPSDFDQSPARAIDDDIAATRDVGAGTLSPGMNPRDEPPGAFPWRSWVSDETAAEAGIGGAPSRRWASRE